MSMAAKEMKVVNPWIHEATHKEYLENVKVTIYTHLFLFIIIYIPH
jgi:hypothetical protein